MAALEVIQSNLLATVPGPVGKFTGGISPGNPSAGTTGTSPTGLNLYTITTGDRVGAGFVTTLILLIVLGVAWWMIAEDGEKEKGSDGKGSDGKGNDGKEKSKP